MTKRSFMVALYASAALASAGCTDSAADKTIDTDTDTDSVIDSDGELVAPVLRWENDAPTTVDDLVVVVDGRNAAWTYVFQWSQLGSPRPDLADQERIDASLTAKGQAWKVTSRALTPNGDTPLSVLEVTIANAPPVTTLTIEPQTPTSSDALTATPVTVDPDGDAIGYQVVWSVDAGTGFQSAGFADLLTVPSSAVNKGEVWRVAVTPNDGEDDGEQQVAEVNVGNAPPTVNLAELAPTDVRTDGTVRATVQRTDPDGDSPLNDTITWKVNGNVVRTGGTSLDGSFFDRGDDVWFEVVSSDGEDTSAPPRESNHVFVRNTPASIDSVLLSPTEANELTTLTCEPQGWRDLDGDLPAYIFAWQVRGVPVPGATSSTLTGADFARNDAVTCTAAANDGSSVGTAFLSNQVTIGNTLPTLASATLSPGIPTVTSTLSVAPVGAQDLDGDVVQYSYAWFVGGVQVPGAGAATLTAAVGGFTAGDVVHVEVTPRDGFGNGPVVTTNSVTITNTLPVTDNVTLTPNPAYTDSILLAVGSASDADGDSLTLRYQWRINTVQVRDEVDLDGDGDTLDLEPYVKGDDVVVIVTPNDGRGNGQSRSVTRRISNTVPSITGVDISPADPMEGSTIRCTPVGWSDADIETPSYRFVWRVGPRVLSTVNDFITGIDFRKGDSVSCQVFPSDGESEGSPITSASVTVRNTPPVLVSASLSSTSPRRGDTLSVTLGASSDADGDTVTFGYAWEVAGTVVSTDPTLSSDAWQPGDTIRCTVTPFDGEAWGTSVTTNDALAQNTSPTIDSFTLGPASPRTADAFTTQLAATDPDGDVLTPTYTWYRNNLPLAGASQAQLEPFYTTRNDLIRVSVTVRDPFGGLATADAGPILVLNTIPTMTGASIQPSTVYEATVVTCVPVGWVDPDGDVEAYDFQWRINGSFGPTGATLTGAAFNKGDTLSCRAWPRDADPSGRGLPVDSATLTVGNTLPTLASAVITPADPVEASILEVSLGATSDADPSDTVTFTYAWTVDDIFVSSDDTLDGSLFAKGQVVGVTVTPTDRTAPGLPVTAEPVTIGNTPPVVLNVSLEPGAPSIADAITANALVQDVDTADTVTVTYAWFVEGTEVSGHTDAILPVGNFVTGDHIFVEVTADDGTDASAPRRSSTVVIGNAAPSITGVTITPSEIREGTTATCVPEGWFDPDGDPPGYEYTWVVSGTPRAATATATGTIFNKGDELVCRVRPYDGAAFGDAVESAPVTVLNTAPSATSVQLSANPIRERDTVSVVIIGQRDPDGDTVTVSRRWLVDGVEVATGPSITGALFSKGQTVQAEVTLDDGEEQVVLATAIVDVVNTVPQITGVVLDPPEPRVTQAVVATPTTTDPDGDTITYTYTWYVAGSVFPGVTGDTLPARSFVKGNSVYVVAVANDGTSNSAPVTSGTVTVVNSPPTASGVTMAPLPVTEASPPTCSYTATADDDGDPVTVTWQWQVNGANVTDIRTLPPSRYVRGQVVRCFAIPFDGEDTGPAEGSEPATVENTPPAIGSVVLTPSTIRTSDAVRATVFSATDLDGDLVTWTIAWFVNDVQVQTGAVLDPVHTERGDRIVAVATPDDTRSLGTPVASPEAIVVNSKPVVGGFVEVLPLDAFTEDTLTAEATATDADGDTVVLTYVWSVQGVVVQDSTSAALGPSIFVKGDSIGVVVTPFDGIENGLPATGGHNPILNTPPRAPVVAMTPLTAIPGVDSLVCSIETPAYDADGDPLTYSFTWREGSTEIDVGLIETATTSTVPAGLPGRGETWVCEARAHDGTSFGPWSESVYADVGGSLQATCQDYLDGGYFGSGVYRVDPDGQTGPEPDYRTRCEQQTAGGGWSRIARTDAQDQDFGQRTYAIVSNYASNTLDSGVYPAFGRMAGFDQVMIKAVTGAQAGRYAVFDLVSAPGLTMLDLLEACRDEVAQPNNDGVFGGARVAGHTTAYSGLRTEGDLTIYPSDGAPPRPVSHVFICGVNTSSDNDVAYLSFSDATGTSNDWGDAWRGNGQKGTIWSFANGDYAVGSANHIGTTSLQALAGWKGTTGTPSGDNHAGSYEIYVR